MDFILDVSHWVGALIGLTGFTCLNLKAQRIRWAGSILSLISVLILVPWAVMVSAYGLIPLWLGIGLASIYGIFFGARPETDQTPDSAANRPATKP